MSFGSTISGAIESITHALMYHSLMLLPFLFHVKYHEKEGKNHAEPILLVPALKLVFPLELVSLSSISFNFMLN